MEANLVYNTNNKNTLQQRAVILSDSHTVTQETQYFLISESSYNQWGCIGGSKSKLFHSPFFKIWAQLKIPTNSTDKLKVCSNDEQCYMNEIHSILN